MKKFLATLSLALVVTLSAVGFAACKKSTSVVGTWKFDKVEVVAVDGANVDIAYYQKLFEEDSNKTTIKFNKDGSGEIFWTEQDPSEPLIWEKNKSTVTAKFNDESEMEFQFSKGKLTFTMDYSNEIKVVMTYKKA